MNRAMEPPTQPLPPPPATATLNLTYTHNCGVKTQVHRRDEEIEVLERKKT